MEFCKCINLQDPGKDGLQTDRKTLLQPQEEHSSPPTQVSKREGGREGER